MILLTNNPDNSEPMSLAEQFTKHYQSDKNDLENPLRITEAQKLCEELSLDNGSGFILTKQQFTHLWTEFFYKHSKAKWGCLSLQFHPKSGHVIYNYHYIENIRVHFENYVYPTRGLSKDFNLFRWSFNGLVCKDWGKFCELIQYTNCEYVAIKHVGIECILSAYDLTEGTLFNHKTHIGGGRVYHEPSAQPYTPTSDDTVVNEIEYPSCTKSAQKC